MRFENYGKGVCECDCTHNGHNPIYCKSGTLVPASNNLVCGSCLRLISYGVTRTLAEVIRS
jgi:hypothetical protein